jgi:hypothetical protein
MRQLKLPWMSVPDQQRMLDMVGEFRAVAAAEENALAKLQVLMQGLMHDLLTRRVRFASASQ